MHEQPYVLHSALHAACCWTELLCTSKDTDTWQKVNGNWNQGALSTVDETPRHEVCQSRG